VYIFMQEVATSSKRGALCQQNIEQRARESANGSRRRLGGKKGKKKALFQASGEEHPK
jgi:hypothetical protein